MLKEVPGAREEAFFVSIPFPPQVLKSLSFARTDLGKIDWGAPEHSGQLGLVLHPELENTAVKFDLESLLQEKMVLSLSRIVNQKPLRERLQEWVRLHPERWR